MITEIYQRLLGVYFSVRTSYPIWYHILNRVARRAFLENPPTLTELQKDLLKTLRRDGIAVTDLNTLFPNSSILSELQAYASILEKNRTPSIKKSFLHKYWESTEEINLGSPFMQVILSETLVNIVNSYMNMYTKLRYYDLSLTTPVSEEAEATYSQRWHRDPQEKKVCKVFIYLSDVDSTAGPFTYIPQSNYGSKFGSMFPQKPPLGVYPKDGEVEKLLPQDSINTMTGKAGTVILCDTIGLHKGGYATKKSRLMFTGFFTAPSYREPQTFSYPKDLKDFKEKLSKMPNPVSFSLIH